MLKLQRRGKKHQAAYRLIVGEKRTKLAGKQTDDLGWYNPHNSTQEFNKERILYWISKGAQMTPRVNNILISGGFIKGEKIAVHKYVKKAAEPAKAAAAPAETK